MPGNDAGGWVARRSSSDALLAGLASVAVFVGLSMLAASAASAEGDGGCLRQGRSICVPEATAVLLSVEGDVRRSRGVGFTAVQAGDDLVVGDRLIVRQGGAVVNLAGHCQIKLGSNSFVSFTRSGASLCAVGLFADEPVAPPAADKGQATKGQTTKGQGSRQNPAPEGGAR